ncbi:globin domain-containing protein [Streptomyces bungoensis]
MQESWNVVAGYGDQVPLFFYSTLFFTHPETRDMFPIGMAGQRDKLFGALGTIVSRVGQVDELVPFLEQLGRDHRKFGVQADHYPAVGSALLGTLAHFLGPQWTDQLAADWQAAYELVAKVMRQAAQEATNSSPPWWDAEVIGHERRTLDVAVLTVKANYRLDFLPGQSVAVATHLRPGMWRYYSPANAPRSDGTIELHVRMVPGGPVSSALVHGIQLGDVLRLGAPVGNRLTLNPDGNRPLLLLAGGTGLAPLKALAEQVAGQRAGRPERRVTLVVGAHTDHDLYDWPALEALAKAHHRWLSVVPAVSEVCLRPQESGTAVEVALRLGRFTDHEVYVCGSDHMVRDSVRRLAQAGTPVERIRFESFTGLGGEQYGVASHGEDIES